MAGHRRGDAPKALAERQAREQLGDAGWRHWQADANKGHRMVLLGLGIIALLGGLYFLLT